MSNGTSPPCRFPPPLPAGARVALVAPGSALRDECDLARAVANARALGWDPVVMPHARERRDYLAGTDEERASDLNDAFADGGVDGVWCLRGGYGSMRLLDLVDWEVLRAHPKAVIGYSDVTALHRAIQSQAGLVSFHGPMAFEELTRPALDMLACAVGGAPPPLTVEGVRVIRGGHAEGVLGGGNLAVFAALCGTSYMRGLENVCLVLEDVKESAYRIDRLLTQLRLSGVLQHASATLFGAFTERDDDPEWSPGVLDRVLDEVALHIRGPVASGVQSGHIPDQWTLPFGARVGITADAERGRVTLSVLNAYS